MKASADLPCLGILMLETRFTRLPGDVGNPATWPFPVIFRTIPAATPERVVLQRAEGLVEAAIAAAREVVAQGAQAIITSCGFLILFQRAIAAAVGVPVATSALLQVPWLEPLLPAGRRVGIITICRSALTAAHFAAAGIAPDTPVVGLEGGRELYRVLIAGERDTLDGAAAEQDVVEAGRALLAAHPEVGAIVLECANLPPYAAALRLACGMPVYDIVSLGMYLLGGVRPRRFG